MAEKNSQFRKDVQKAKAKYSRRRNYIILVIMSIVLIATVVQTAFYVNEKKKVTAELSTQNQQIETLDKENKVNEVVIDKLKDPYFISDLVRQEYGLSYEGELIFNLPQQENFLESTIRSIMDSNAEQSNDNHGRLDDSRIPELNKKDDDSTTSSDNKDSDSKTSSTRANSANSSTQTNQSNTTTNTQTNQANTQQSSQNTTSTTSQSTNQRSNR